MKNASLIVIFLWILQSCNIVNPKEEIPTYIQIDSVQLVPTHSQIHGSVSHKITDVWVYYNREILGAYQLPAKIPVIADGKGQLQILAGIWDNGLSGTRARYPFFTVDTFTFDANPTQIIHHTPIFNYRTTDTPSVKYFIESFEQGNTLTSNGGDTTFYKTNNPTEVFEGDWSAKVALNDSIKGFSSITTQEFSVPIGQDCYMELNYKTDIGLIVAIEINSSGNLITSDLIGLNPRDNWNKVYLNLKGYTSGFQNAKFKIIFYGSLPDDKTSSLTLIDNFKIIYFNKI
ncbi:MAG: hypothetical protein IT215_08480 [Chitinophagaceae bacterium]|nr:hypothetical protein [Chitinophagaceae bacterium]HMN32804.1 hypothetical protein [Chitinophagaceae bacterium]